MTVQFTHPTTGITLTMRPQFWFSCPNMVGDAQLYVADSLKAAQGTATVNGWNPANVAQLTRYIP